MLCATYVKQGPTMVPKHGTNYFGRCSTFSRGNNLHSSSICRASCGRVGAATSELVENTSLESSDSKTNQRTKYREALQFLGRTFLARCTRTSEPETEDSSDK